MIRNLCQVALGVLVLSFTALGRTEVANSSKRIGERIYIIEEQPFAPVEITRRNGISTSKSHKLILRDPGTTIVPKEVKPPSRKPKIVSTAVLHPLSKLLRFKKVMVKGYLRDPRIQFTEDPLDLQRSDVPLARDFFQETFEDEQSL